MIRTELPIPRAFHALAEAVRVTGLGYGDSLAFALSWLAAARMVLTGNVPGLKAVDDLGTPEAWKAVAEAGLPVLPVIRLMQTDSEEGMRLMPAGKSAIRELVSELGVQPWDVLPALTASAVTARDSEGMVRAEVAELMLDVLGTPSGELWVPFDRWGALTVRALRRGWQVKSAQMLGQMDTTLPLLLAIEYGQPKSLHVNSEIERDREGRPLTRAECVLACPPFGLPVHDTRLGQWDSVDEDYVDRFTRSETWALRELVGRTARKAVFLVSPAVLFTLGQEQRLRAYLLHRGGECNELQSVISLPGGAVSGTNVGSALLALTPDQHNNDVLMVDLGLSRRSASNLDELVKESRMTVLGEQEDPARACRVGRADIERNEVSFAPSRYLRKAVDVGPNAVPLGAVCDLLRAPTLSKEESAVELLEMGIPELGDWAPAGLGIDKKVRVRSRRDLPTLQQGDLVLSIKGSTGKTGIVGDVEPKAVVTSQSCVGLRVVSNYRDKVSGEFLLMYLRSAAGQAQLESLQAGATVPHISPQSLLSSFLVPIPEADERAAVEADYRRLCQMERQMAEIQQQMKVVAELRWAA